MKQTVANLLKDFASPPEGYGPIPFWFWNDELKDEDLLFQLHEMYDKGIREYLIHARLGLQVPYLSEAWFQKVSLVIAESEKLGMSVWIYDEENWPSGYAGGLVLKKNPEHSGKYLRRIALTDAIPEGAKELAADEKWRYVQCDCHYKAAYSNYDYTDMLSKAATEAFIDVTHREYFRRFGDKFGTVIKGFFVDEPGFYNNFEMYMPMEDHGTYTWTGGFADYFREKKGYDILPVVGQLWQEDQPETLKVRMDYYDVLAAMYKENFLDTLREFCEAHGVQLIGHLHCEEFLPYHVKCQGDMIRNMPGMHFSGVDRIDLNPEKVTEKYGSAAEHIYDMGRTLSETFAISGWELTLRKIRQWTNWQYVRGVNLMCLHAFFSCIEGDRQHDCPPSLFYQNPYWQFFGRYSTYVTRLSWILSQGRFSAPIGVYYPIRTVQKMVRHDTIEEARQYDRGFIDLCNRLTQHQMDYDILNADAIEMAHTQGNKFFLHGNRYGAILLYELQILEAAAAQRILTFAQSGVPVIIVGNDSFTDEVGNPLNAWLEQIKACNYLHLNRFAWNKPYTYAFDAGKVAGILHCNQALEMALRFPDPAISCMHRVLEAGDLYFVCNELDAKRSNTLLLPGDAGEVLRLNAETGEAVIVPVKKGSLGLELALEMEPFEGVLYLVTKRGAEVPELTTEPVKGLEAEILSLNNGYTVSGLDVGDVRNATLRPWSEFGAPTFSGEAVYEIDVPLEPEAGKRYILKLGRVCHTAQVIINGNHVADLIWDPYEADLTPFLQNGKNSISIRVANTLANRLNQYPAVSGLLGPVTLCSVSDLCDR